MASDTVSSLAPVSRGSPARTHRRRERRRRHRHRRRAAPLDAPGGAARQPRRRRPTTRRLRPRPAARRRLPARVRRPDGHAHLRAAAITTTSISRSAASPPRSKPAPARRAARSKRKQTPDGPFPPAHRPRRTRDRRTPAATPVGLLRVASPPIRSRRPGALQELLADRAPRGPRIDALCPECRHAHSLQFIQTYARRHSRRTRGSRRRSTIALAYGWSRRGSSRSAPRAPALHQRSTTTPCARSRRHFG